MTALEDFNSKKEAIVIDLFLRLHDNTVKNIALKSGLLEISVHKIINTYLGAKKINHE